MSAPVRLARRLAVMSVLAVSQATAAPATTSATTPLATTALADAPRRCVPVGPIGFDEAPDAADSCQVVAFGRITSATPALWYQLQVWVGDGQTAQTQQNDDGLQVGGPRSNGAGVALLTTTANPGMLVVVAGAAGRNAVITQPRVIQTAQGPIVVAPAGATMSMHPNFDLALRVVGGRWAEVADAWSADVRTPKGVAQRHGSLIDWHRLRAYGAFWRPGDAECCASGGSFAARLRLAGARLKLASVRYSRGEQMLP